MLFQASLTSDSCPAGLPFPSFHNPPKTHTPKSPCPGGAACPASTWHNRAEGGLPTKPRCPQHIPVPTEGQRASWQARSGTERALPALTLLVLGERHLHVGCLPVGLYLQELKEEQRLPPGQCRMASTPAPQPDTCQTRSSAPQTPPPQALQLGRLCSHRPASGVCNLNPLALGFPSLRADFLVSASVEPFHMFVCFVHPPSLKETPPSPGFQTIPTAAASSCRLSHRTQPGAGAAVPPQPRGAGFALPRVSPEPSLEARLDIQGLHCECSSML